MATTTLEPRAGRVVVLGGLRPPGEVLPHVLPAGQLRADGRPIPELRDELRHISDGYNAIVVAGIVVQAVLPAAFAFWIDHPAAYVAAFLLAGRAHSALAIVMHEAAHRLLFSNRKINDFVGKWVAAYPTFTPIDVYRRSHMAHHREEFGPDEPDIGFYGGYPDGWRPFLRRLGRDLVGISGWKNLRPLFKALRKPEQRPFATGILGTQVVLFGVAWLASGAWWAYFAFWLVPWMTIVRVSNRLRSIAEHGGCEASTDRRVTTHHVRQNWLARSWIVPLNTGWHLAHHVDSGIPWRNLPKLHAELVRVGYVTDDYVFANYRSMWMAAARGRRSAKASSGLIV